MSHPLHCRCGTLQGTVDHPRTANRVVCYCKDCQAFAHFLEHPGEILDERGGSDIIQVLPKNVTFTQGAGALACMRLTPKGTLRWYTSCCNTPIGNTVATPKVAFIGLLHNCLESPTIPLGAAFGPVGVWVNTQSAKGDPKPKAVGAGKMIRWFLGTILKARLNGDYKQTPFFRPDTGASVVSPRILSPEEHAKLMDSVRSAA